MKKEVIYIDIEDDITAIIGKVKAADAKIIALVPPKRIGVLQSAVNLKLLKKSAGSAGRHVVLITSDHSLIALAAGLKLPVAKNLQSKPEVPTLPGHEESIEEVINGADLPVGELVAAAASVPEAATAEKPVSSPKPGVTDAISQYDFTDTKPDAQQAKKTKGAKQPKIPNFGAFRKRLFLVGGGAIVLIALMVWAFVIAPHATVTIKAKTTTVAVDRTLGLDPSLSASKTGELQLKPVVQQIKKTASVDFDATGTKDIGDKASGQVTLQNSFDSDAVSVPTGTVLTATSGQKFATTATVSVPGFTRKNGIDVPGTAAVTITAADIGTEYNIAAQSYAVQAYDNLKASGDAMSGGSKERVTVVAQADIDQAKTKLAASDAASVKTELKKKFTAEQLLIDESYTNEPGSPSVSPSLGEQAKRGKLTLETTYTLVGLERSDVRQVLESALKDALDDKPNQSIFSSGENSIRFQLFQKQSGVFSVQLLTTGYIGSKIDTDTLAKDLRGKRYGEIEQTVNAIPNVEHVDIAFSPFWVTTAPNDTSKITIKFTVVNDGK